MPDYLSKMRTTIKLLLLVGVLTFYPVRGIAQTNDDCLTCHSDNKMTMTKNGKEVSIFVDTKIIGGSAHKNLSCISCHVGFNPDEVPHKEKIEPIDCKSCHRDAPLKHQFHPDMIKKVSISGQETDCKKCHGTHDIISPKVKNSKFNTVNIVEACGTCHTSNKEKYEHSAHYKGFKSGVPGAPICLTCHRNPSIVYEKGRDTLSIKVAQQKLCLSCHLDNPEIRARTSPSAGFISSYSQSVHGIALSKGNSKAATCIDCHTSHEVNKPTESVSTVNKFNIPQTCSKCHSEIAKEYSQSIHGISVAKGNAEAPVCTDCHGEHNILKHTDSRSPVAYKNLSSQVCSPCHSSVKLTAKFGIDADRFKTFSESYHGLALEGGSYSVANCSSCHGVHNIKPASDPTSMVNKANLSKTCGRCHPGANENFGKGKIHVTMAQKDEPILYWLATLYIILILSIVGAMFLHNFLDLIKKAKNKKLKQRGIIAKENHGHSLYLRMSLNERIQHILLALSFILLVLTGFMLRFPDSWWVSHIRSIYENVFVYRGLLHRISAVVLVSVSLYHIFYISFTRRGRKLIFDLLPKYRDLKDAIGIAKYNLGISKEKPKLDRFSYVEKAEYWALIWGTILMSATGTIMWFDNTFIGLFTKLGFDIARTIHYYEAWLAFLSIVVWHFYFVIFNPEIYPMNIAWLKGTISEEEMAEEHPAELERIKKQDKEKSL
ncbi:MAG: cytochrome b/b6 domain-containing protein [Ignavibacteriaceae bacterium]|nr:cytochrome b/b6 domain-containing protein [Ignavibacteriaceae bacterium]